MKKNKVYYPYCVIVGDVNGVEIRHFQSDRLLNEEEHEVAGKILDSLGFKDWNKGKKVNFSRIFNAPKINLDEI